MDRNKLSVWFYSISLVFLFLTIIADINNASSLKWLVNILALAMAFCPIAGLYYATRDANHFASLNLYTWEQGRDPSVLGYIYGLTIIVPIMISLAIYGNSIYYGDILGGFLLLLSGIFSIMGGIAFKEPK